MPCGQLASTRRFSTRAPPDPALRSLDRRPARALPVLYAGRFSREKDLTTLLRFFEPFTEAALALIGSGGPVLSFASAGRSSVRVRGILVAGRG